MTAPLIPRLFRSAPTALGALLALFAAAPAFASESAVGQVSLLIGEARVVRKDGTIEALRRGAPILVGDRVETSGNGHVHVRFIDSGAVSVRPESVLEVQAYHYDASNPRANEVRLQLEQGSSRSISGRATDADKNRFRLNTPIAAIGVRGTDFIVQSSDLGVRATVAEGAIVVGALGGSCTAAGLGPCSDAHSRLLTADMGRLAVEVLRGEHVARLVPVAASLRTAAVAGADERLPSPRSAELAARSGGMLAAQPYGQNDRVAAAALNLAESTPDANLNRKPEETAQLVWGRYTVNAAAHDGVSVHYAKAQIDRRFTVGDADYTLFRSQDLTNPDNLLTLSDPKEVKFRLGRGEATFESGLKSEAATFVNASLALNFGKRTFVTGLELSSPSAGRADLLLAGNVRPDGTFSVRDSGQYVAGAVSLDGKEAGYLFERGVAGGLFRGKTLWGH